jgi:hypothetical protein
LPDRAATEYRRHRLEILAEGPEGCALAIRPPGRRRMLVLCNRVPRSLPVLLEEARARVDRRLDGAAWQREP